ncbi:hypothetical protein L7D48_14600, partial [Streptomyces sp. S1A]|uniref:DNA translocase FtsK n=1 Tax=Streptomyces sp. ICN903 TaxID=2964654 RepID=UPI0027385148
PAAPVAEAPAPRTPAPEAEPKPAAGNADETAPSASAATEPATEPAGDVEETAPEAGPAEDENADAPAARVVRQAAPSPEETEAPKSPAAAAESPAEPGPADSGAEPDGGPFARQAEAAGMDAGTLREIAQAVVTEQNASMVYVQQRFSLSRTAARRALDALEQLEVVSAPAKNGRRKALVTSLDHLAPAGKR